MPDRFSFPAKFKRGWLLDGHIGRLLLSRSYQYKRLRVGTTLTMGTSSRTRSLGSFNFFEILPFRLAPHRKVPAALSFPDLSFLADN